MPERTPRGNAEAPPNRDPVADETARHGHLGSEDSDQDTVADTGVEGGVDAPNEDLDEGLETPGGDPRTEN